VPTPPTAMAEFRDADAWLIAAETALARRDAAWPGGIEALLDDDFREVGASGWSWTRSTAGTILAQATPDTVGFEDFGVEHVAPDVALVTYRTREPSRVAKRVSVWVRGDDRAWRLRYHQGTVIPADNA
jgi:glyoxylase I family protein